MKFSTTKPTLWRLSEGSLTGSQGVRATSTGLDPRLAAWADRVNERLHQLLPGESTVPPQVHQAERYAVLGPGKRLRPVVTLAVAETLGVWQLDPVVDLGCAVELVHASSLILDDLPCMDNATLRRGRPTVHLAFGEDMALLAAYELLARAFGLVAEAVPQIRNLRHGTEEFVHVLAQAIGSQGLVGGQALDLRSRPEEASLELLETIHSRKTGALFLAAAELGALAANARRREREAVQAYAKNLGLAFQIVDDLLDVLASPEATGKDAHQDQDKVTFVALLGIEGARSLAQDLLDCASDALVPLGAAAEPLRLLVERVSRNLA